MANVFIIYSRQDTPIIDRLVRRFAAASVETWVDRNDLRGGDMWRGKIVRAIKAADAVLVALSPDAIASDNVRKELDIAEQARKPLLPVEIRPTALSDELAYQLSADHRSGRGL
jgi:TIR domain